LKKAASRRRHNQETGPEFGPPEGQDLFPRKELKKTEQKPSACQKSKTKRQRELGGTPENQV
jgi:hypothetical protein